MYHNMTARTPSAARVWVRDSEAMAGVMLMNGTISNSAIGMRDGKWSNFERNQMMIRADEHGTTTQSTGWTEWANSTSTEEEVEQRYREGGGDGDATCDVDGGHDWNGDGSGDGERENDGAPRPIAATNCFFPVPQERRNYFSTLSDHHQYHPPPRVVSSSSGREGDKQPSLLPSFFPARLGLGGGPGSGDSVVSSAGCDDNIKSPTSLSTSYAYSSRISPSVSSSSCSARASSSAPATITPLRPCSPNTTTLTNAMRTSNTNSIHSVFLSEMASSSPDEQILFPAHAAASPPSATTSSAASATPPLLPPVAQDTPQENPPVTLRSFSSIRNLEIPATLALPGARPTYTNPPPSPHAHPQQRHDPHRHHPATQADHHHYNRYCVNGSVAVRTSSHHLEEEEEEEEIDIMNDFEPVFGVTVPPPNKVNVIDTAPATAVAMEEPPQLLAALQTAGRSVYTTGSSENAVREGVLPEVVLPVGAYQQQHEIHVSPAATTNPSSSSSKDEEPDMDMDIDIVLPKAVLQAWESIQTKHRAAAAKLESSRALVRAHSAVNPSGNSPGPAPTKLTAPLPCTQSGIQVDTGGVNGKEGQKRRVRRGMATDRHSLAERARRGRISECIRELQEIVPNANKGDTASVLDEAISYVKSLQHELQHIFADGKTRSRSS